MERRERVFTFNFSLLIFATLSLFTIFQGLMYFMPVYMMSFGVGEFYIGLAAGIFMLIAIFSRPFTTPYADKYGLRDIMVISLLVFGLATFCYIWARNVIAIFLLRAIQGVAWGVLVASAFTLAAKLAPRTRQAEALGYFSMVTALGGSIGPALIEAVYSRYTYTSAIIVFGGLAFFCLLSFLLLKEPDSDDQSLSSDNKPSLITWSVIVPSLVGMLTMFCYGTVVTFLPVLGQVRGMANVSIFFTVSGAVSVIGRLLSGRYVDRYGQFPLITLSGIFFFFAMLIIALAHNLALLLIGAIFVGLGLSLSTPALMSLVVALASKAERSRAMSTFTGFYDLGIGTGSIGIGFLLSVTNITIVYLTCAGIMLMNLVFVLYQSRLRLKKAGIDAASPAEETLGDTAEQ